MSQTNVDKSLYKYHKKGFLISRAEHEFFDILIEVLGNQYYVFPQIHLIDILDNKVVGQNWKGAFSHINQKSVDYVICDKAYIKPLLAIELDDRSHDREDRKNRDENVEQILKDANMPLLRFENNGNFNREEIKGIILEKLNNTLLSK
jgi:very-short-patch-repair endonuclease